MLEDGAEDAPAPEPVDTKPNLDDEWPEEDVKPKKGKKGKKGKKQAVEDDEDDESWFVKPDEKEKAAEEVPEVKEKAAPTPPPEDAEAEAEDDGAPRVRSISGQFGTCDSTDISCSPRKKRRS